MVDRKPWYVGSRPHRRPALQLLTAGLVVALLLAVAAAVPAPGLVLVAAGCTVGAVRLWATDRWHREHGPSEHRPKLVGEQGGSAMQT